MSEPMILREDRANVAHLTLNLPAKLNALSSDMLKALLREIEALEKDTSVRVVVLRGAGKAFCAGHDLREISAARQSPDKGASELSALFELCSRVMLSLQRLPQPVIAQVHGIATAAGCQLVATCDLAVAADDARFGVNGVNIGLFCSTPMVALSRNVTTKQAFEMLTTGTFLSATQAQERGLINRSVPVSELAEETAKLAGTIASKLGSAVKIGKQAFYTQLQMSTEDAYAYTGDVMVKNMALEDTDEGVKAFLEKRDPDWAQ